ncbi:MAG TPA: glycoside hydrolase family 31 protein [Gemmatimonadota bacterium]|nr:glycoside hydrolase family 31 protein [Gemmatimonadota bacterium]
MTEGPRAGNGQRSGQSISTATSGRGSGRRLRGRAGRRLAVLLTAVLLSPASSAAQADGYTFLGEVVEFEPTGRGADLRCQPDARLEVAFLGPGTVRVTLDRPDRDEVPLMAPLLALEPEPVEVEVVEDPDRMAIRSAEVEVSVDRPTCRITFLDHAGHVLSADEPGLGIGWDGDEVRNWKTIEEGERFFGLGEKTGNVDKRGREWVMWTSDIPGYGNETDPLYQSIPFFLGLRDGRAYGFYLNNSYRTAFNLGAANHRYYSFAAEGDALDYFFFAGPEIPRVVERYTAITGRMPLPPRWALGYQQSRWSYYPDDEVLRIVRTFREKRIPADVIYLDIHYMDDYRVFTWHPERFPDPEGLLAELEALGFKAVVIIDPGVKEDEGYAVAEEGLAGDHFVRYPDGEVYVGSVWPGRSYFPDFSGEPTRAWWGGHLERLLQQGVDGIWNDMNEPAVWGKAFPVEVESQAGSFKRVRNLYGLFMAQGTYEELVRARPDQRPFILTRSGFAGIQRYAAVWTGDNVASWEHLELGIRMLIGLGLSGVPFVGADVGGFIGGPSPELFARWIQVGALSPFFRGHTAHDSPPQEPWAFGEEVEAISRQAIELRYRMLPYLYSLFRESSLTGAPVLRPLFWHHQSDSTVYQPAWQHQFLLGERLLVAPVTREGAREQEVYLPEGRWLDLATEEVYDGGRTVTVDAPLDRIPMFLRAGGILPMREVVQHLGTGSGAGNGSGVAGDGLATLTLEVFPAGGGEFELYEDDGLSFDYRDGEYRATRFLVAVAGGAFDLVREVIHDGHAVPDRVLEVRFHAVETAPDRVEVDGRRLSAGELAEGEEGFSYDPERRVLIVRVRPSGAKQSITVRLGGASVGLAPCPCGRRSWSGYAAGCLVYCLPRGVAMKVTSSPVSASRATPVITPASLM